VLYLGSTGLQGSRCSTEAVKYVRTGVIQGCRGAEIVCAWYRGAGCSKVILMYCRFSRVVQVYKVTGVVRSDPRLDLPN
jgi:hypothetical protein